MGTDLEYLRSNAQSICRTCYQISSHLHPLFEKTEQFPLKSLADLLHDIAKININEAARKDEMPAHMCGSCSRKLKNAYTFVLRAHEVDKRLMKLMPADTANAAPVLENVSNNVIKHLDCLLEAPIDIPLHETDFLKIKMESEYTGENLFDSFSLPDHMNDEFEESVDQVQNVKELLSELDEDNESLAVIKRRNTVALQLKNEVHSTEGTNQHLSDPIKTEKGKRILGSASNTNYENEYNDSDSDWEEKVPKRRRGRRAKRQNSDVKGRYSCEVCGKTFAWKKDLKRHALSHSLSSGHKCNICERYFTRKDKLNDHLRSHQRKSDGVGRRPRSEWNFAERLYTENRFKKIECKLCDTEFKSTNLLRLHLENHSDISTLQMLQMDNEVIRALFPQTKYNLDELKSQICEDVSKQCVGKFYAIVNEHGYELSLSDSDTDVNYEPTLSKYNCELCSATFARKYQAFVHMKENHKNDKIPYKCNVCKVEFISLELFEAHIRTQCRNKEKKYQCLRCPGKFMWVENLDNHNCSNRFNSPQYKSHLPKNNDILQCNICEKTFVTRKDLKRHKETHDPSGKTHECSICFLQFLKAENLRLHYKQMHAQLRRRIECCLCGERFSTLKALQAHLPLHADGFSAIDSEVGLFFRSYSFEFSEDGEPLMAAQVIANDFARQNISRFYLAVDESGNELNLDESETDNETGTLTSGQHKVVYTCEICGGDFGRRKQILLHQSAEHGDLEKLPHRCEHCNKQFVCSELLQSHLSTDCLNAYKKWNCNRCSARFVWEENLQAHLNIKHLDPEQQRSRKLANKLQCDECDKTFIWPKDLIRHKRCHLPEDEKYECPLCPRRFNRKDNMQAHVKIHGDVAGVTSVVRKELNRTGKQPKVKGVDEHLCKPNGSKLIKCMICFSKHTKIADLRTHLRTHQYVVSLAQRAEDEDYAEISLQLYPEEAPMNQEQVLIKRIVTDISEHRFERFYSITNEVGYELNISDSETESDSEEEDEATCNSYACDLCSKTFDRKYKLFEHEKYVHEWLDLPHICEVCDARFASEKFLQIHLKTQCKNLRKLFMCKKCPLKFMWKENLKMHERTLHPDKEQHKKKQDRYECKECNRTFAWQKDLTRHEVIHKPEAKAFACLWCPRRFHRKDKLHAHIKRHDVTPQDFAAAEIQKRAISGPNGNKTIHCKICGVQFSSIYLLRAHILENSFEVAAESQFQTNHQTLSYNSYQNYSIRNELGFELHLDDSESDGDDGPIPKSESAPTKYTCEICQMEFKRKYEIAQHQMIIHPYEPMPHKCEKCIFKTVSQVILVHHMSTQCFNNEKEFECKICFLKFMWKDNLDSHVQIMHPKGSLQASENSQTNLNKGPRSFQCELCKCKYNRKDRLTAHIKKVHLKVENYVKNVDDSQIDPSTGEQISKPPLEKKFLCAFCGRAVTSSSNLIIHMRRHTGEKPFKCEFCDMAFPRSSDLQCHRRTHTGEKPHKCTVCDKAFSRSYKLHTHMRIHSGERPYKCTYCEKSFTQSNDLTLHVRRHTGERPYVCGICGERFIQGTALKNHRTMRGHYEDVEPRKLNISEQF